MGLVGDVSNANTNVNVEVSEVSEYTSGSEYTEGGTLSNKMVLQHLVVTDTLFFSTRLTLSIFP
jgi:hypothetical protein